MRGISLVSAVTLAAEVCDFTRFESAPKFMSYVGLVPSEHSSGEGRRQGRVTRAGNGFVRRILVEAGWSYRYRPRMSTAIRARNEGLPAEVQQIAWRAQERLCARYRKLTERGKNRNQTVVAIARELAAYAWAIARHPALAAA